MTLTVWSEQGEAKWRDCLHASDLMLMVFGGVLASLFKLGINTSAERERFEDAEGLPESQQEQGLVGYSLIDVASRKLYGVVAHDATEAELPGLLATVGVAIALTGNGPGLSPTPLYPSGFQGNHSVTVVPLGNGQVCLLDPLQRSGTTFSPFPVATILAWHRRLTYGQDIRYVRENEFKPVPVPTPAPKEVEMAATTIALGSPIGVARVNNDVHVRGITINGAPTVLLTLGGDYAVYGDVVIPGFADPPGPTTSAAWRIAVDGETRLLKRNATYTPIGADLALLAALQVKINAAKVALA